MSTPTIDFPVFDADNHFYETQDAVTKYLPKRYQRAIEFVEVRGRTKIALNGQIANYIPNPSFEVVAAPGTHADFYNGRNVGGRTLREMSGTPIRPLAAYREPAARLELLDELGIDATMIFPSLASVLEQRLTEHPDLTHAVIHALNEWMHEVWSFDYEDRIYATPIITLPIVDRAIEELEWVLDHGARVVLIRPAPAPGLRGSRSPADPEFDPFWARVQEAGILVAMHQSDTAMSDYLALWEGQGVDRNAFEPSPFRVVAQGKRDIEDALTAMICHGALSRFPNLRIASIENGASWVPHLLDALDTAYRQMPQEFAEHPVEVFKRNIYISPFWEDDPDALIDIMGPDHVLFGSDYPHPEGLADPLSYAEKLSGQSPETLRKVMSDNARELLRLPRAARAA